MNIYVGMKTGNYSQQSSASPKKVYYNVLIDRCYDFSFLLIIVELSYCYNPPQYLASFTSILPANLHTDASTRQIFVLKGCLHNANE